MGCVVVVLVGYVSGGGSLVSLLWVGGRVAWECGGIGWGRRVVVWRLMGDDVGCRRREALV